MVKSGKCPVLFAMFFPAMTCDYSPENPDGVSGDTIAAPGAPSVPMLHLPSSGAVGFDAPRKAFAARHTT